MTDIYQIKLPEVNVPYDIVDKKSRVSLTQAQYDALTTEQKMDPTKEYFITDATPSSVEINDSVVSASSVYSSQKVNNMHKVARSIPVSDSSWTEDTTSQSGTTLYKKQITLNHIYVDSPVVELGCASGSVLPTALQQERFDTVLYATADDSLAYVYLYATEAPTLETGETVAFYVNIEGVD